MRRVYLLAALAFGAVLLGLLTLDGSLLIFSVPLIVFIASSLLFSPTRPQLEIARKLDIERVSPGGTVTAQITVTNHGGAIEAMQLTNLFPDGLQLTGGMANIAAWLRRGESKTFTQVFSGQRGQYIFDEIAVHAGDHFDLFSHRLSQAAGGRLVVVPRAERLKAIKIRPRRTRVYAGLIPTRSSGPGIDYYGIRQYVAGDPLRWVDWKTSARHQDKFFTKLFEQERAADVGLILDARRSSSTHAGESSIFEHSIQAAAALSETLLAAGNRVGLLVYG
ncbi:MAG: DUF58 domain-containing protein, partial [Anaerolineae bacterium]|nr:DUF58 domain-containing protein [Anaerolineae bacterium]